MKNREQRTEDGRQRTENEYISTKDHRILLEKCKRIGKMLGKMMAEPEKWCTQFKN